MVHVRIPYRINLVIGILAVLAGCRDDASRTELEALRAEVAQLKQAQAQMQGVLATLQSKGAGAPAGTTTAVPAPEAPGREAAHRIPSGSSPRKGPQNAAVTVVEFADFQCPFCQQNAGLVHKLVQEFPNDVEVVFKNFPLGKHTQAVDAARAAWAANQQGRFWEMHDAIYSGDIQQLPPAVLRGYAERIGLDMARYDADVASDKARQAVAFDKMVGKSARVNGTPTYFVNGKRVQDASPQGVRAKVREELDAARAASDR